MAQASWGAKKGVRPGRSRGLWWSRVAWSLAVVLLGAVLGWLLWRPFRHPRTHLVLLAGDVVAFDSAPFAPPADYVAEDFRALLSLESVLHRGLLRQPGPLVLGSLRSADEMQKLADRLNERISGRGDVVILYATAHGLTQDGDAWLLGAGADRDSPLGGRYRLASLLAQLRECEAETKVLLLDAGRIEYDPLRGLVDNDFPERLVEQVEALGDPSIYVLVSHAAGQRSHLSPALRRSVFGYFVASGLSGEADANGNRSVDLGELSRFVIAGVSGWVRQTTGEAAEQTPILAWGGAASPPRTLPPLIAVPARPNDEPAEAPRDHAQAIESAREQAEVNPRLVSQGQSELNSLIARGVSQATPQGRLGQFLGDAARRTSSKAIASAPKLAVKGQDEKAAEPAETAKKEAGKETLSAPEPQAADSPPASKEPAKAAPPAGNGPPGPARDELAAVLAEAWKLRDELADAERASARPADFAPHLWRQLEQRLLNVDRKLRTGFLFDTRGVAAELAELNTTLQSLVTTTPSNELPADSLARAIVSLSPGRPLAAVEPSSLALAELLALEGARPLGEDLSLLIAQLDRLIATGNRTDLEAFAAKLKPEHQQWLELRIAARLAARPDLDWRLVQLTLTAARLGEQAAVGGPESQDWVRATVEPADAQRLAAERQLLASAIFDREAVIANLTQAIAAYQAALSDRAAIRAAERLANDASLRLPDLLVWNAAAENLPGAGPTSEELSAVIANLGQLDEALLQPGPKQTPPAKQAAAQLRAAYERVTAAASPAAVEQLLSLPIAPGKAWKIALVLETPFPTADMRAALTTSWPEVDAAVASQVQRTAADSPVDLSNDSLRADDTRFLGRADLQQRQWQVAASALDGTDYGTLRASWEALTIPSARNVNAGPAGLDSRRKLFAARLHDLLRDLPADIARGSQADLDLSAPASRGARLQRLTRWNRLLRLTDPRTPSEAAAGMVQAGQNAAAYDLLTWLRDRSERAAEDAPPFEAAHHRHVAQTYRAAAAAIPRQPPLGDEAALPLVLGGPERISLTYQTERQADFTIHNAGAAPLKVWLTIEADDRLLDVSSADGRSLQAWDELTTGPASRNGTLATRLARLPATLELASGQTAQLPLRVVRRRASEQPAHIVIRAVTEQHLTRHDLVVELPPPADLQLTLAGPPGRWTPQPAGVELLPFPNCVNNFALRLASGTSADRQVDVEIYPLLSLPSQGLPPEPLTAADALRLRREMSVGPIVAEARGLALPGSGESLVVPLEKPKAPEPMPPTDGQKADAKANGQSAAAKAPAGDKPLPVPLTNGLLAVLTDRGDQRQTFRHLAIAPQRPQRYVQAQVRYRAARERVEIVVTAQDPSLLPESGARIRAEIAEPLAADAERQLEAVLKRPAAEAELFAEVASEAGKFVTLALTIDDYPRAIYFRVPTSGETSDVPEDLDLLAVRILDLPKGTIYKPPLATIPVQLAIDAPAAALKSPLLSVEIGIDRNRDRELRGDEIVTISTDRRVTASLLGLTKAGELQIEDHVGDVTIDVPAGALVNGRANLIARAILGEREAWSAPVEIVSDSQPPRVSAVETRPTGVAVIGSDVLVSALADDLGQSGVAQMEVAFDLDRSGKIGPTTKAVPGALADDGRWTAKLPTAGLPSGASNILVRATDRAGNASEPARASIRLLTAEEAAADAAKNNAADISGVVTYGGQPQAGVTVSLLAEGAPPPMPKAKTKAKTGPPPLAQATTDAQGRFTLARVAPGKYVVVAEGLVRNKNRRAEEPVAFAKPADLQPLALEFK